MLQKQHFLSRQNGTARKKVVVDFVLDLRPKTLKLVASLSKEIAATQLLWTFLEFSGEGKGPTVCEACMSSLGACITQTIVAHATARGINLDSITIDLEGKIDLRGFTGISSDVGPGAQGFKVNVNIKSSSASKEQISELYEIGKKLSPAFDTLTNGTSVIGVNSS